MKRLSFIVILMSVLCFGVARADVGNNPAQADTVKINRALEFMRENYPEAQYADVYKNFMQDYFYRVISLPIRPLPEDTCGVS